jgi:hypothetical protein
LDYSGSADPGLYAAKQRQKAALPSLCRRAAPRAAAAATRHPYRLGPRRCSGLFSGGGADLTGNRFLCRWQHRTGGGEVFWKFQGGCRRWNVFIRAPDRSPPQIRLDGWRKSFTGIITSLPSSECLNCRKKTKISNSEFFFKNSRSIGGELETIIIGFRKATGLRAGSNLPDTLISLRPTRNHHY